MKRHAIYTLCAVVTASATPSFAQSIPEGQSCGGLLCDMGVFGHKTAPSPAPAPPASPAPIKQAETAPPKEIAPEPTKSPPKKLIVPRRRMAKAVPKPATPRATPAVYATGPAPAAPMSKPKVVAEAPKSMPKSMMPRSMPKPTPASSTGPAAAASPIAPPPPAAFRFRPLYNF